MIKSLGKFITVGIIYTGFAVYLYQPYFKHFDISQYLIVANACLGALGCFVLSRRWVWSFAGSFFAGAIYGFGPFAFGLAGYHPTAGFLSAVVPWLFCPAAYGPKLKWRWLQMPLCALPFLAILLFFQAATHFRLFAIPIQTKLQLADLASVFVPLVATELDLTLAGFYHVPIGPLVIGFSMLLAARRIGVMAILAIGVILAFCPALLNISPIIWLTMPVLCCSVIIGAGVQGLVSAGSADRKWILMSTVIMAVFSIVTLLLAVTYTNTFAGLDASCTKLLAQASKMYLLGTVAVGIIYFTARGKLRIHWIRLAILCSAMAIDVFFSARFIVDKIF